MPGRPDGSRNHSYLVLWIKYLIVFVPSRLKATSAKPREESPERRLLKNKQCEKVVFPQESNLLPLDYRFTALIPVHGNPKAADSIPARRQLFCIACF